MSMDHPGYTLGILGYPLGHSLSPRMHTAALRALALPGDFRLFEVPPLPAGRSGFAELFGGLRRGEVDGICITIPHKQAVLSWVDELTPTAQSIGAANVVFRRAGRLVGDNTDAPGFLADLDAFLMTAGLPPAPGGPSALVLGAGGAARAVVYALAGSGWQATVAARRVGQAQELVDRFRQPTQHPRLLAVELDFIPNLRTPFTLLVNTTPLGMSPHVAESPWPAGVPFPPGAALYDLVYNPPETGLMRAARQAGLPARGGLGMLVEQGALAFERWTEAAAPREAMRRAVESYLTTTSKEDNR